jgi:hypothetical protein
MLLKYLTSAGCTTTLVAAGALISPAAAYDPPQPWDNYRAVVVDRSTVDMNVPADYDDASFSNDDIDYPVQSGDVVSFYMDTQGNTSCTDYYPLLQVRVDEARWFTSYDDGTPCPGEQINTQDDGRVSFVIRETGRVDFTQFYYYDNDGNTVGGGVQISDLRINDEPIYFAADPGPDPEPEPTPVATPYGASLTKPRPCVVRVFAYHDAALEGQVASPKQRRFITRVDGQIRSDLIVRAGNANSERIRIRANSGRRIVAVRLLNGELIERIRVRTGHC